MIATHGDTAAVAGVSAAWDAAWNAGNAAGIGALFVDDAEFVNGRGQVAVGATTIIANHAANNWDLQAIPFAREALGLPPIR